MIIDERQCTLIALVNTILRRAKQDSGYMERLYASDLLRHTPSFQDIVNLFAEWAFREGILPPSDSHISVHDNFVLTRRETNAEELLDEDEKQMVLWVREIDNLADRMNNLMPLTFEYAKFEEWKAAHHKREQLIEQLHAATDAYAEKHKDLFPFIDVELDEQRRCILHTIVGRLRIYTQVRKQTKKMNYPFEFMGKRWADAERLYLCGLYSGNTLEHTAIQQKLAGCKDDSELDDLQKSFIQKQRADFALFCNEWMLFVVWQNCLGNKQFAQMLTDTPLSYSFLEKGGFLKHGEMKNVLDHCRSALKRGVEPSIDYMLLERQGVSILGHQIDFVYYAQKVLHPEDKLQLTDGRIIQGYTFERIVKTHLDPHELIPENGMWARCKKDNHRRDDMMKEQLRLFTDNAFFFLANSKRILSDSRMFMTPISIIGGFPASSLSGYQAPILGVYLEWWNTCEASTVIDEHGDTSLVFLLAGNPAKGTNYCAYVNQKGVITRAPIPHFNQACKEFIRISQRYTEARQEFAAFTLEEVLHLLHGDLDAEKKDLMLNGYFMRNTAIYLRNQLETEQNQNRQLQLQLKWNSIQYHLEEVTRYFMEERAKTKSISQMCADEGEHKRKFMRRKQQLLWDCRETYMEKIHAAVHEVDLTYQDVKHFFNEHRYLLNDVEEENNKKDINKEE